MIKNFARYYGLPLLLLPALSSAVTLTVQVEREQMRSQPSFFSPIVTTVRYKSLVDVLEARGAWRRVKFKQQQGWMHISALTKTSLSLKAGRNLTNNVSGKEVSLAGKGFDAEVEKNFKQQHREVSFTWVDYMEKIVITPSALENFVADSDFPAASW